LAATRDIATFVENRAPPGFPTPLRQSLVKLLVNEQLRATNTDTVQYIQNILKELDEVYGARKTEMSEMAGTAVICLTTAPTSLPIIENTHARVEQTTNTRLVAVVCARICHFYHGPLFNLIRTENPELDTYHGLDIRIWTMKSGWHLSSVL
jgi:hypothetical protein